MAEKVGPIFNRILIKKLDQALENGSINKKDYNDLKKKYFGKPKLIQMDLFDPDKKKQGGLMEATKRLKAKGLKKGGFPDLSGDGKVTMKDILMGRGVVKKPKKKAMGGSMTLQGGKLKGVKVAPEERRKEKIQKMKGFLKRRSLLNPMGGARGLGKVAGRAAKRGYGIAKK
jgi:hypothetical protein